MRLVLDTSILVSSLLRKGTSPYLLYQAWREGGYELITSKQQMDELRRVLHYPKLQRYLNQTETQEVLAGLMTYALLAVDLPSVHYSPDPDDNWIIATAIVGEADYLVTGDKADLLALAMVENIQMVTAKCMLDVLESVA